MVRCEMIVVEFFWVVTKPYQIMWCNESLKFVQSARRQLSAKAARGNSWVYISLGAMGS